MVILLDLGSFTPSLCRIPQSVVIESQIRNWQILGLLETWLFLSEWWFGVFFHPGGLDILPLSYHSLTFDVGSKQRLLLCVSTGFVFLLCCAFE